MKNKDAVNDFEEIFTNGEFYNSPETRTMMRHIYNDLSELIGEQYAYDYMADISHVLSSDKGQRTLH